MINDQPITNQGIVNDIVFWITVGDLARNKFAKDDNRFDLKPRLIRVLGITANILNNYTGQPTIDSIMDSAKNWIVQPEDREIAELLRVALNKFIKVPKITDEITNPEYKKRINDIKEIINLLITKFK